MAYKAIWGAKLPSSTRQWAASWGLEGNLRPYLELTLGETPLADVSCWSLFQMKFWAKSVIEATLLWLLDTGGGVSEALQASSLSRLHLSSSGKLPLSFAISWQYNRIFERSFQLFTPSNSLYLAPHDYWGFSPFAESVTICWRVKQGHWTHDKFPLMTLNLKKTVHGWSDRTLFRAFMVTFPHMPQLHITPYSPLHCNHGISLFYHYYLL